LAQKTFTLHLSLGSPVFIGIPGEKVKGEGFLLRPFFINADATKMPTYSTNVPSERHNYAI
jgi:hypothetical protein